MITHTASLYLGQGSYPNGPCAAQAGEPVRGGLQGGIHYDLPAYYALPIAAYRKENKEYYNDITSNNLDLIKSLREEVAYRKVQYSIV